MCYVCGTVSTRYTVRNNEQLELWPLDIHQPLCSSPTSPSRFFEFELELRIVWHGGPKCTTRISWWLGLCSQLSAQCMQASSTSSFTLLLVVHRLFTKVSDQSITSIIIYLWLVRLPSFLHLCHPVWPPLFPPTPGTLIPQSPFHSHFFPLLGMRKPIWPLSFTSLPGVCRWWVIGPALLWWASWWLVHYPILVTTYLALDWPFLPLQQVPLAAPQTSSRRHAAPPPPLASLSNATCMCHPEKPMSHITCIVHGPLWFPVGPSLWMPWSLHFQPILASLFRLSSLPFYMPGLQHLEPCSRGFLSPTSRLDASSAFGHGRWQGAAPTTGSTPHLCMSILEDSTFNFPCIHVDIHNCASKPKGQETSVC